MNDYIVRASAEDYSIRIFAVTTKKLVEEARQKHNTSPVATAALGRLLTAGAMMGSMLKGDNELLTLQIKGDGPIKGLLVTADAKGNVKGYVNNGLVDIPTKENGKLDVSGAIGAGSLIVIKDLGLKEPYIGQTELVTGEIAEDITYYYATSEQTPSAVGLGVLVDRDYSVKRSGGFIVQLMPGVSDEVITKLENNLKNIGSVTQLLEKNKSPEDIVRILLKDMDIKFLDTLETQFICNCSQERVEKALISLGIKEIQEMIEENKKIEMNCHFCNKNYIFSVDQLKNIARALEE